MIYHTPDSGVPIDQGDLVDGCPVVSIDVFQAGQPVSARVSVDLHRAIVLTNACDIANRKVDDVLLASVFDAQQLIDRGVVKAADVKGPIRAGRVWGMYFLPANAALGLNEMIVDLRRLHTVRLDLVDALRHAGQRVARIQTPYREHLAKHFADMYSRIGLPQPYETL